MEEVEVDTRKLNGKSKRQSHRKLAKGINKIAMIGCIDELIMLGQTKCHWPN